VKVLLSEALRAVGGDAHPGAPRTDPMLTGVSIDSRTARPGDLFVALRGETLDGHDFAGDALGAGAVAALVARPVDGVVGLQIVVPDPLAALTALAAYVREDVDPLVVGITGSVGKTTTKDLVAAVLGRRLRTVAALRSFNNDLGVPLTLLAVDPGTEAVVCEMGARGPGHISALCRYVRPHVGIVTNIGVTHYAEFGSREAIAEEKSQLVRALPATGAAVLNADDPVVLGMAGLAAGEVVTYGLSPEAFVRAEQIEWNDRGRPSFRIVLNDRALAGSLRPGGESAWVSMKVSGRHQVSNALAAVAAGIALGVPLEQCAAGLREVVLSPWRMEVHEVGRGDGSFLVVNDAYNASPASMASALETCAGMVASGPAGGRLVAVLGYIAELGGIEEQEHERVGALAAALADEVLVVGRRAAAIAAGALKAGMERVRLVDDADSALEELDVRPGDVVLVKASRVAGLESLAQALLLRTPAVKGDAS
jgi:UDP-N-acetylmuramoyl-tripeptide--D-alanyl-D-alanine ligase